MVAFSAVDDVALVFWPATSWVLPRPAPACSTAAPHWASSSAISSSVDASGRLSPQCLSPSTFIQRETPKSLQGRTFSLFYGAIGLAAGVSYLLDGLLLAVTGPRVTFMVVGFGGLFTGAFTRIVLARGHGQPASSEPPAA